MSFKERKIVSVILGGALQVPGLATFGPRLVAAADANHPACEMSVETLEGEGFLKVKYKGKNMSIPLGFVALIEWTSL